jgi:hypothetical protein
LKAPQGLDRIHFLADRKFSIREISGGVATKVTPERRARTNPGLADEISIYKAQLLGLPPDELQTLFDVEFEKFAEEQEQARFFNQSRARADIAHWSKAAHWTLDEAIALSFGKAPEVVNWENIQPFLKISAFAFQYGRVRDLALRAIQWKQLFDPVLPGIFVAWAKRNDISIPPDLEAALAARGVQVADWKSLYDDLERQLEASRRSERDLKEAMGSVKSHIDEVMLENDKLAEAVRETIEERDAAEARAAELQSKFDSALQTEKPVSLRERESLLKLVIGMATAGYKYDAKAPRSMATSEIASDLEKLGIGLDVDTVRKWVKEAAEILPGDEIE